MLPGDERKKHLNVLRLMLNIQEGSSDLEFTVAVSQSGDLVIGSEMRSPCTLGVFTPAL